MSEPKNYALIDLGLVVNIIWLNPENANEFPNVVCIDGINVSIGDLYDGTKFITQPVDGAALSFDDLSF